MGYSLRTQDKTSQRIEGDLLVVLEHAYLRRSLTRYFGLFFSQVRVATRLADVSALMPVGFCTPVALLLGLGRQGLSHAEVSEVVRLRHEHQNLRRVVGLASVHQLAMGVDRWLTMPIEPRVLAETLIDAFTHKS